jgi:hypothetical protein
MHLIAAAAQIDVRRLIVVARSLNRRRYVAIGNQPDTRARCAHLVDNVLMAWPVENDDGQVADATIEGSGDTSQVFVDRRVQVDHLRRPWANGELFHVVDAGRGFVHAAATGSGDDRDGSRRAERRQPRAVHRIDRDIKLRRHAIADLLADEEHGRLVLLALADHDDAVHIHAVQRVAHRIHRRLVHGDLIAAPHVPGGRISRRLGDTHQLQADVALACAGALKVAVLSHAFSSL